MNKTNLLFAVIFMFSPTMSFAQTTNAASEEKPFIEVNGTAEKEVIPDEIYIAINIRERYKKNDTKVTIEEQEANLKSALQSIGIDLANLSLSDAEADYVTIRWRKKDVLAMKDYILKVSTAAAVAQVYLELEKLEIDNARISRVNHSQLDSLKKEVKILAMKDAKNKADYLLEAIGEQTGKPSIIRENEFLSLPNVGGIVLAKDSYSEGYYYDEIGKSTFGDKDSVQFQKIKIQSTIYAKFLIK